MRAGDVITLTAESLDKGGRGMGHHHQAAVVVNGLLPGEVARIHIDHVGQQRAHGHVLQLLERSPHRRQPPCRHQGRCGGCPLMIGDEAMVRSQKRELLAQLGFAVDRVAHDDRPLAYRWSSKRVLGGHAGAVIVGSFRSGTHDVVSMKGCWVDHPDIAACFDELEDVASELMIEPYNHRTKTGELRFAWAKTDNEGRVLLTLVTSQRGTAASRIAARLQRPAGVATCIQGADGNAMRGDDVEHLTGISQLEIRLGGATTSVGPLGFLQPNPPVAALAYADLLSGLSDAPPVHRDLALDLYAGAGVTTQMLAATYDEVQACEAYPESAHALGLEPETAEAFLRRQARTPRLIVANPPRSGLGEAVCDALMATARRASAPIALHVMSCEPRALARDLERLTSDGDFELAGARAYDTLPQTAHIEVVVWLTSNKVRGNSADSSPLDNKEV